ncbi:MAG: hypothetical protein Q8R04_05950 [Nanoarchaeota archaeon]|nr:hypothetical protein [Nanoarchaeota archaeon]
MHKRKPFLAFASLLFALAISFAMIKKLSEQGRTIPYLLSFMLLLISLSLHYFFIYKRKDRKIPLFHYRHHVKVVYFYLLVFISSITFAISGYFLTGILVGISEFLFLIAIGTIMSLITYEITD